MKEIKKERTVFDIVYQAIDGTEFRDKHECEEYEASAYAVINSKYRNLVAHTTTEYDLFMAGSEENTVEVIKLNNNHDIDVVFQMWSYINKHSANNETTCLNVLKKLESYLKQSGILFIYRGYEEEYSFCIMSSYESYIERLNNIISKENE